MDEQNLHDEQRRAFLRKMAAAPLALSATSLLGMAGCNDANGVPVLAVPTPECDDGDEPTPAQTEGPFFTPNSPERTSLIEAGIGGTVLVLTGQVLTTSCRPVAGALLDFWHADGDGAYDNEGYRLRGHQYTDAEGRFRLETVVAGLYPGRTRHIHVKAQAPNQRILTTQLYWPGESRNARDGLYRDECLMAVAATDAGQEAVFNFILDMA